MHISTLYCDWLHLLWAYLLQLYWQTSIELLTGFYQLGVDFKWSTETGLPSSISMETTY